MYLAYDNMCNVNRLKVARAALPLPPPMDKAWLNIEKIIDTFHLPNHVNPENAIRYILLKGSKKSALTQTHRLASRRLSGLVDLSIFCVQ